MQGSADIVIVLAESSWGIFIPDTLYMKLGLVFQVLLGLLIIQSESESESDIKTSKIIAIIEAS